MSFTGRYTPFIHKEEKRPPKILDLEKWKEWCEKEDPVGEQAHYGKIGEGEYPQKHYKTLRGFKTWEDEVNGYNIERLGYQYDSERFIEFLEGLAEVVETPFYFYHPYQEHWPSLDGEGVYNHYDQDYEIGQILKVTVTEESVTIEKSQIKSTEFEEVE